MSRDRAKSQTPTPESEKAKQAFADAFRKLLGSVEGTGHPVVFIPSQFWTDRAKDDLMKAAAEERRHVWIDLSPLIDESCYASSERQIDHAGVANHPGDHGMQVIADAIWKATSEAGQFAAGKAR